MISLNDENVYAIIKALHVAKTTKTMQMYQLTEILAKRTKSNDELENLIKCLLEQDETIYDKYAHYPKMIADMDSFSECLNTYLDYNRLLQTSFKRESSTCFRYSPESFDSFMRKANHSQEFNDFRNFISTHDPKYVYEYHVNEENHLREERSNLRPYNHTLRGFIKRVDRCFEDSRKIDELFSSRERTLRSPHTSDARYTSSKTKTPIRNRLIKGAIVGLAAFYLFTSGIKDIQNANTYNSFTYEMAEKLGYDHNDMNLSPETYEQIQNIQSLFDKYNNETIPSYSELTGLISDVISVTNNVFSDKTTAAFESANPGSKVTSVRHYFDDSTKEQGNLLKIEYTDTSGIPQTIVINNNFEDQGFIEGIFTKDDIGTSYQNDRTLDGLFDDIRAEYDKTEGDPYKQAPIAKKYLQKLGGFFTSTKNLAAKHFLFTQNSGLVAFFTGKHKVSSQVPADYEQRLENPKPVEDDFGRD